MRVRDYYNQYLLDHFPHTLTNGAETPDAIRLYRQLLAAAAPRSLIILEAAYLLNLAELVLSAPDDISPLTGEALLNEKVKLLAIAAGDYPSGTELYFRHLPIHAGLVVNRLRCPMIFSGNTLGDYVQTAHGAQLRQLLPTNSILRCGYEQFYHSVPAPGRPTWAQNLILYVLHGPTAAGQKLYEVERGGYNFVDAAGGNTWRTDEVREHAFLVPVAPHEDITAALTSLMYLPAGRLPLPYDPYVNLFAQLVATTNGTASSASLEALDAYVKTLKADGTWRSKRLVWPCVGEDLNAARCLLKFTWGTSAGILSLTGAAPSSYAEREGLVGNGAFQLNTLHSAFDLGIRENTCHLAVYSHRDMPGESAVDCGRYEDGEAVLSLALHYSRPYARPFFDCCSVTGGRVTASETYPTTGYFMGNRVGPRDTRLYRNQQLIAGSQSSGGRRPYGSLLIYSYQEGGPNVRRTLSHFSCGPGLNAKELETDGRAIEDLQAALGRSVRD